MMTMILLIAVSWLLCSFIASVFIGKMLQFSTRGDE